LDSDGNSVSTGVFSVLGEVDDDRGKHDTNGDAELVSGNERSTDLARANFGHVWRGKQRESIRCSAGSSLRRNADSQRMMIAETNPTPKPAIRRPMTITARPLAANICMTTPARYCRQVDHVESAICAKEMERKGREMSSEEGKRKVKLTIPQPAMIVGRRPIISARSPAMRAPKKVPADKIETMREVWEELIASAFPAIERMNSLDESTPLMYPESYPKKIPPNEAKAHLRKEEEGAEEVSRRVQKPTKRKLKESLLTSYTP